MMLSALGLPNDRSDVYGGVQRLLQTWGLGVYVPQRLTGESDNIGVEYDTATGGLDWKPATVAMMRLQDAPMVMQYGVYYYSTKPATLRWPNGALWRTQDDLHTAEIAGYLKRTNDWLVSHGIRNAWILVDEPPHLARYGLTPIIEARVIKMVNACAQSGLGVAIATPNANHYEFWRQRVTPSWWILFDRDTWPNMPGCWLYNSPTYVGLADRMRAAGAVGYLQWSAVTSTKTTGTTPILCEVDGDTFHPTEHLAALLTELSDRPKPVTVEDRLSDLERRVSALETR